MKIFQNRNLGNLVRGEDDPPSATGCSHRSTKACCCLTCASSGTARPAACTCAMAASAMRDTGENAAGDSRPSDSLRLCLHASSPRRSHACFAAC